MDHMAKWVVSKILLGGEMLILLDEIAFFCGKHMNCKISRIRESDKSGNRLLKMRSLKSAEI